MIEKVRQKDPAGFNTSFGNPTYTDKSAKRNLNSIVSEKKLDEIYTNINFFKHHQIIPVYTMIRKHNNQVVSSLLDNIRKMFFDIQNNCQSLKNRLALSPMLLENTYIGEMLDSIYNLSIKINSLLNSDTKTKIIEEFIEDIMAKYNIIQQFLANFIVSPSEPIKQDNERVNHIL